MRGLLRTIKNYWVEIILALLILVFSEGTSKPFLFFFFIVALNLVDTLSRFVRVFQIANELKMLAIVRKLKISDEEMSIVLDGEKMKVGEDKWKQMEKEISLMLGQ